MSAIENGLAVVSPSNPEQTTQMLTLRARIHYRAGDLDEGTLSLLRIYPLGPTPDEFRTMASQWGKNIDRVRFRTLANRAGVTADDQPRCEQLYFEAVEPGSDADGESAWIKTYSQHLTAIAGTCSTRGVEVLLVSYPFHSTLIEEAAERIAERTGSAFVKAAPEFDRALADRPRSVLFAGDGHCNDAGYALLAELVGSRAIKIATDL
jgi:hypothetical protein